MRGARCRVRSRAISRAARTRTRPYIVHALVESRREKAQMTQHSFIEIGTGSARKAEGNGPRNKYVIYYALRGGAVAGGTRMAVGTRWHPGAGVRDLWCARARARCLLSALAGGLVAGSWACSFRVAGCCGESGAE